MEFILSLIMSTQVSVSMGNHSFIPKMKQIEKGSCITWTNDDKLKHVHDVNFTNIKLRSKPLKFGETFKHCFSEKGVFKYKCSFHPNMVGEIEVK